MDPQTWNRYAYVRNSPLEMTDPLGLDGCGPATAVRVGPRAADTCTCDAEGDWCFGGGGGGGEAGGGGGTGEPCSIDGGGPAPCGLAGGSDASAQCPNNDCTGLVYQGNSFYKWDYSRYLQFVCNGDSSSDCSLTHDWLEWVSDANPNIWGYAAYPGDQYIGPSLDARETAVFSKLGNTDVNVLEIYGASVATGAGAWFAPALYQLVLTHPIETIECLEGALSPSPGGPGLPGMACNGATELYDIMHNQDH